MPACLSAEISWIQLHDSQTQQHQQDDAFQLDAEHFRQDSAMTQKRGQDSDMAQQLQQHYSMVQ
ncbi:hypothetical protein GN244_ATG17887 [Phytophthora infestans]|uniref:Uncharacterized protein n=1 Tax=Phytophthora infestans TaxID=4787 RepID=A0A833W577_PHYIN|nr:hypothetical protein GN244_ATG17887 [Phytophthora infestans]